MPGKEGGKRFNYSLEVFAAGFKKLSEHNDIDDGRLSRSIHKRAGRATW